MFKFFKNFRRNLPFNFSLLLSHKREFDGIQIAVFFPLTEEEVECAFHFTQEALKLIEKYAPQRYQQIRNHIKTILIGGDGTAKGRYVHTMELIELSDEFVLDADTYIEQIAQLIVHEAQHEKLNRHGFGYSEDIRNRIEVICITAERGFLKRLPDHDFLVERTNDFLEWYKTTDLSNRASFDHRVEVSRNVDMPNWLRRLSEWKIKKIYRAYDERDKAMVDAIVHQSYSKKAYNILQYNWHVTNSTADNKISQNKGQIMPEEDGARINIQCEHSKTRATCTQCLTGAF